MKPKLNFRPPIGQMAWLILALGVGPGSAQEALPELRTAEQVRRLTADQAERHYPVRLRGVVTFFNQGLFSRFVQDDTAGIYLQDWADPPNLLPGQLVEVEGKTSAGEYAPVVTPEVVRVVGEGRLPDARPASFDELASGRDDSQLVEVTGIVRSTRRDETANCLVLEIATGGGRFTAYAPAPGQAQDLVDSQVRLRGVCSTEFNRQRQLLHIRLLVPRPNDLAIQRPAPADPFAIPSQNLGSLLQFTPEGTYGHRTKVAGTVVYQQLGGSLFIQDEKQGLLVQTTQRTPLRSGDQIEVLGFPATGDYTPILQDAIYRVVRAGAEPKPARIGLDEALQGTYDCRLVRLEAHLLDRARQSPEPFLVLQINQFVFHAYQGPNERPDPFSRLANGSQVAVTGVCAVEAGSEWRAGGDWRAKSFHLLLRSSSDVAVLRSPPWWTLGKMLWMVAMLGLVVLGAFAWVGVLRRRVQRQTGIIRQKLAAEGALKQRYLDLFENANDIVYTHDLAGRLTSINQAGEDLLQLSRQEILAQHFTDLIAAEQRTAARQWLEQVFKGAAPPTVEWDFTAAAGQRIKLEISTRLIEHNGHPVEVEGIARDITERKRLEQEILEISNREQRRIGHDLHDGVCQQLVGISYLTEALADRLQGKATPESAEAGRISGLLNTAIAQTRAVARGLFPVRLEENGLASALEELAANASSLFQIPCHFVSEHPPDDIDHAAALHLYYIAREAVANAAKHSRAANIYLSFEPARDRYALTIRDDGAGFSPRDARQAGMGLRIMHYRARVIGATLEITSLPAAGTQVCCLFSPSSRPGSVRPLS